ncbi:MAG: outer membrane protein transport protein [candidate division Zixibacteria bacterium]|nr:outer membrane protein transport protein [candidate division Zixibacteria bacterium]
MKPTKKLAILTALSLSLSVSANAQTGLNDLFSQDYHYSWSFYGGGARAAGLGNAYTALSNDVFATSWNPAGMVDKEEIYLGFDWNTFSPKGSFDFDIDGPSPGNIDHSGGANNFFRNVGLTAPVTIRDQKFVIGISQTRHFDTYSLFADNIFPSTPDNPDITIERDGGVKSANFGIATRISESFSMGVAANVYFGDVVVEKNTIETYNNTATGFQGTADFELFSRELDSFKLSGFNLTIGGILEMGDNTRLALTAKTPFKMSFSNDVFSSRFATTEGGPPAKALEFPAFAIQTRTLASVEFIFSDVDSKVEIPYSLALGWAQNWGENFLTSMDVEYQSFSGSKFLILDSTTITSTGRKVNVFHEEFSNWKNTLQLRAGAEYTINSRLGNIPLRTGFGILPQPYRDVADYSVSYSGLSASSGGLRIPFETTDTPGLLNTGSAYNAHRDIDIVFDNTGDQVIAYSFSLGAGLHSPQRALDVAYVYNTSTRSYTTSAGVGLPSDYDRTDPLSDLTTDNLRVSEVKSSDHKFIISFTGYF